MLCRHDVIIKAVQDATFRVMSSSVERLENHNRIGILFGSVRSGKCTTIRKYRRQAQSHLEELEKLQPIKDNNAEELETFADILKRAVLTAGIQT